MVFLFDQGNLCILIDDYVVFFCRIFTYVRIAPDSTIYGLYLYYTLFIVVIRL